MKKTKEEISIKDLLNVFIPKIWIIVVVALILGAGAFVKTAFFTPDTYTSSIDAYFYSADSQASMNEKDSDAMVEICQIVIESDGFLKKVIAKNPNRGLTTSFLRSAVSFRSLDNGFLRVSVTTSDPTLSFDIARSFEELLPPEMIEKIPDALSFIIFESANLPKAPNSVPTIKNTVVAALIGAVATVAVIWVVSIFDIVIHDKKKIEDSFDVPILAVIPRQEVK